MAMKTNEVKETIYCPTKEKEEKHQPKRPNCTMMDTWLKVILLVLAVLVVSVGVPFLINECYEKGTGYITVWNANDVLSYYGTILAAVIGVLGVYLTVWVSNKNYRDDARNRILPYIAINVMNIRQPDPFLQGLGAEDYAMMGNDPIIEQSLEGKAWNHLYFVIDGKGKIRVAEQLSDDESERLKETAVTWIRAKDGKMYIRDADVVSMPFVMDNIGNGVAKNLRMSFSYLNSKQFFKTEIILKPNERFYIHIFSEKGFEIVQGEYVFSIYYEDISGNEYEQLFPVEIVEENGNRYKRIETNGKQRLLRRAM